MHREVDAETFIEALGYFEKSSGRGNAKHLSPELSPIL
jgi:hypothetical protein